MAPAELGESAIGLEKEQEARPRLPAAQMRVEDRIFYHIAPCHQWQIGLSIDTGPWKANRFYSHYESDFGVTPGDDRVPCAERLEAFRHLPEEEKHLHCERYIQLAYDVIKDQAIFIREVLFEQVRAQEFPEHPSRTRCMWLCTHAGVESWWRTIGGDDKEIYGVRATGNIHRGDERHLRVADTFSHKIIREHALRYWSGSGEESADLEDIIFEGCVRVLNVYKNLQEFKERAPRDG